MALCCLCRNRNKKVVELAVRRHAVGMRADGRDHKRFTILLADISSQPWYHGHLTDAAAESILLGQPMTTDGTFLVYNRNTSASPVYVIAVAFQNRVFRTFLHYDQRTCDLKVNGEGCAWAFDLATVVEVLRAERRTQLPTVLRSHLVHNPEPLSRSSSPLNTQSTQLPPQPPSVPSDVSLDVRRIINRVRTGDSEPALSRQETGSALHPPQRRLFDSMSAESTSAGLPAGSSSRPSRTSRLTAPTLEAEEFWVQLDEEVRRGVRGSEIFGSRPASDVWRRSAQLSGDQVPGTNSPRQGSTLSADTAVVMRNPVAHRSSEFRNSLLNPRRSTYIGEETGEAAQQAQASSHPADALAQDGHRQQQSPAPTQEPDPVVVLRGRSSASENAFRRASSTRSSNSGGSVSPRGSTDLLNPVPIVKMRQQHRSPLGQTVGTSAC